MGELDHGTSSPHVDGDPAVARAVGKSTPVARRYGGSARGGDSGSGDSGGGDGGVGSRGGSARGDDATTTDDPFGLHLLGGSASGDGSGGDQPGGPIRAAVAHPIAIQRAADPAQAPAGPAAAGPGAAGATAAGALIVADGQPATDGRMDRAAFLALLQREVTATATEALGPAWSVAGCPYIERWFARHADTDAASLDRMARRYAGAAPTSAAAYIAPICARLRTSIERWRGGGDVSADLAAAELTETATTGAAATGAATAGAAAAAGPPIQRKADGDGDPAAATGATVLDRLGPGTALPSGAAARMEAGFGDRFDDVRIHTDDTAQAQAREQGALAFTVGNHVAFAAGQFQPGSPQGDALLAHELAHVQQQRGGDAQALARKAVDTSDQPAAETDADHAAEGVLRRLYNGASSVVGRIGASMSTGLSLQRCKDPQPQHQPPVHDGGTTGPADAGPTDAGPTVPVVNEASVTALLQASPVDAGAVLGQLRQLTPVGPTATPGPLDNLINTNLTGDAHWRAQNLRLYGPEDQWPPILRGDTAAILAAARSKLTAGTAPEPAAAVADALRPLNPTAQHQAITVWRHDIPSARFGGGPQRTAYFDSVMQLLDGPRFGPADDLDAVPPLLDLTTRTEPELYAYFQRVCSARGFTFSETDVAQPINSGNPLKFNAFNIRGYDQTTAAGAVNPRMSVTRGTDFTGRMFLVWQDARGQHARNWEWSNTGIGGTKLGVTHARGDDQLRTEGGVDGFSRDARGKVSATDTRAIRGERDVNLAAAAAATGATDATTQAATATTQAAAADAAAGDRSQAGVATTGTQALAQTALVTALGARQAADRAIQHADRALALLGRTPVPAGMTPPADSKSAATAAKATAAAAFETARGAWVIARQQLLATNEETTRRAWEAAMANPAATAPERTAARAAYDAAQRRNNQGYGEGNPGQMSEANALPWLQEGQYVAHLRSGDKGGHPFWSVDAGIGPAGNGTAPVDRDWDADGRIDPGERDVPGTAVGTGVLIHRGDTTHSSIGCQVAPEDAYAEFVAALSGQGRPARSFAYIVVEGRHLPPWAGAAAPGAAPGGGGGATSGDAGAGDAGAQ